MPTDPVSALASFAADVDAAKLPADVSAKAHRILFDTIIAMVAGQRDAGVMRLTAALAASPGECTVPGTARRADRLTAALLTGTAAVALELDEGCALAGGHPAAHVVPVVLAVGEAVDADGADVLAALVAGYEVATHVSRGVRLDAALGAHGSWTTLGGAAAAARLLSRDARMIRAALLNACAAVPAPLGAAAVFAGHGIRNVATGLGNQHAIVAAQAAMAGITAPASGLGIAFGEVLGSALRPDSMVEGLGESFDLLEGYTKPYPLCRHLHGPLDALVELRRRETLPPADAVDRIVVSSHALVARFADASPPNAFAARFSVPASLAAAYLGHPIDEAELGWFGREDVNRLAARVVVDVEPEADRAYPRLRRTRLAVVSRDGARYELESSSARGDAAQPMDDAALASKFRLQAGPVLGSGRAIAAMEILAATPGELSAREIVRRLAGA